MSMQKSLLCSAIAAYSCVSASAYCDMQNDTLNRSTQDQIIVSATRSEQSEVNIPTNIIVINAEEIQRSGSQSLPDLLRSRAGIQVQDDVGIGSRGTTLIMRGFGSNAANNTLVLLDGQKLNNPSLAAPDLSSIALADIERVEIIQGSAGVLFGDQATGGVINIITKHPQKREINLEVGRGTLDWESYRASASEGFDNGFAYRLTGEHRLADNYRDNNNSDYANTSLNVSYTQNNFRVFGEAQQVNDKLRLAGSLNPAEIRQNRRQTDTPNDFSNRDTTRYRIGTSAALNPNWRFEIEYSYRDVDGNGHLFAPFTDAVTVKGLTPRLIGNFASPYGPAYLTLGYDQYNSDYLYHSSFYPKDATQSLKDEYAQLIIPIYEKLTATIGGRQSHANQDNHLDGSSNSDRKFASTYGLSYQATESWRIFARKDNSFRWANADENASTLPGISFLKPQTNDSREFGTEWTTNKVKATATLYRLYTDNELLYDPAANGGFGANINLPRSRRDGVNGELQFAINEALSVRGSVGYVDAEVVSGDFKGNTVPFVANYTGSSGVDWQIIPHLSLYVDAQYTGRRYRVGDDPNILGELGGYTVYNANLRWEYNRWYTTLRVNNITNKKYEGFTGVSISSFGNFYYAYPAAERQSFVTVGYTF